MSIFKEKYRIENRIFETNMSIYTIKQDSEGGLFLLNEEGKRVPALDILQTTEPHRVYAFYGKMGAGKTTFIKQLCQEMGTDDVVNSPTFAIVNVYDVEHPQKGEVYHFDCYRLKNIREALDFGAEEYLYSGNYCLIEWPEMIDQILPEDTISIHIDVLENGDRRLTIEG